MCSPYATLDGLVRLQYDARHFALRPSQPVSNLLSGRRASRLRGRGLTFDELRDYRPGDDIRAMDWKATARLRKPHVRIYTEERERPVLLVVDQRSTMFFGSQRTTKATAASEAAALCAWRAIDAGDRVGAIVFGDHDSVEIRPRRSRANVLRICHELVRLNRAVTSNAEPSDASGLNRALERATNIAHHDFLVVLITDYYGDDDTTHRHVTRLAAHNDVLAALVYDPAGIRFTASGPMTATDSRSSVMIPEGDQFGRDFEQAFRRRCERLRDRLRSIRIPILPICTHDSVVEQVHFALGAR